jgi:hypothetical protein
MFSKIKIKNTIFFITFNCFFLLFLKVNQQITVQVETLKLTNKSNICVN